MKELSNIEELIIRFLDGYATEQESIALQDWMNTSETNRQLFEDMKAIWEGASDAAILNQLDVNQDWNTVKATMQQVNAPKEAVVRSIKPFNWLRTAAAGMALLILGTAIYFYINRGPAHIEQIALQDGSIVWLEKGSTFTYPDQFDADKRSVQLEGKAFFDITKDPNRPFIIESGQSTIEVLGTSFNVVSSAQATEVVVNSGKVRLAEKAAPANFVDLSPNELGTITQDTLLKAQNTDPNYLSWKTGVFVFNDTPMERVFKDLSSYYQVELNLRKGLSSDCPINANFKEEQLDDILKTLAFTCDLDYSQTQNGYQFFNK